MESVEGSAQDWFKDFEDSNALLQSDSYFIKEMDIQIVYVNDIEIQVDSHSNNLEENSNGSSSLSTHDQILNETPEIFKAFEEEISCLKESVKSLRSQQNELINRLTKAENIIEQQDDNIHALENDLYRLDQYGRRENVEFHGIPENIKDNRLEPLILNILKLLGLKHIQHYHIVACHRIGKPNSHQPRGVIVRFLNRKDAISCLKYKYHAGRCKEIGLHNLTINENLCPAYRSIFENLADLKNQGKVKKLWTQNGFVNFKFSDTKQEKSKKVTHEFYLYEFFPDEFE